MTEKLFQFIWAFGYFNKSNLATTDGEAIALIAPGQLNKNQGPDFLQAKVKVGTTTLFGSVELHLQTSDWEKHKHGQDKQYNNVILHVVYQHDKSLPHAIPVLELQPRISALLIQRYQVLMNTAVGIPCANSLMQVKALTWQAWKERLVAERLTRKALLLLNAASQTAFHWEQIFWQTLARSFGGKVNADAFEAMATTIPVTLLAKHKNSIHQLEALLFGQANLLNDEFSDAYPQLLQREYRFLKTKYNLVPSPLPVLFLRMRPGAFPTIRLAQLAAVVHNASHLFSTIIDAERPDAVLPLLITTANDFWHYHYTFSQASAFKKKTVGSSTAENSIINAVVPLLFAYGLHHRNEKLKDKALLWMEQLPPEVNSITREFDALGIRNQSAYDSQALLELKNEYCSYKKCLDCAVGNNILREAAAGYSTTQPATIA